jgi:CubicO group peptidase (beta-lactamase class C family)
MLKITGSLDFLDRPSRTGWTSPTAPRARLRQKRWIRLVAAGLACVLAAACTSPVRDEATPTSAASPSPTQRDYWPTAGWRTAAPDQQGMNPAVLDDLNTVVPNFYPQVRSVLVIRHGYLVYEGYWHGFTASDGHDSRSVTKSFVSALVGIALRDRHLESLDQTVEELLADHLPANADPRLRQATVKQLLAMTSGLASDDSSLGGDDKIWDRMARSRDWIRHTLGRRLESNPGERFAYSSATSHLLSAIMADSTGQSTLAFARAELFGPLGIATDHALELTINHWPVTKAELETFEKATVAWPRDPQGYHLGDGFLKLPARDLAKLGYLYLNDGRWDGTQVVPADYVRASTQPQSDPDTGDHYGYQWWVNDNYGYDTFRAQGYGGQLIYVIPKLDLVVVITSDPNQERNDAGNLVWTTIVPAVTG